MPDENAFPRRGDLSEAEIASLAEQLGWVEGQDGAAAYFPPDLGAVASAAESGNVEALRGALAVLEGSMDAAAEDGDTPLHLASLYGHYRCIEVLLDAGARVDVRDEDGAVPLHDAAAGGYTDIADLLLRTASGHGATERLLRATDADGDTPLHHAARGGHPAVIRLLLAARADVSAVNVQGKTPRGLADPGSEAEQILQVAETGRQQEDQQLTLP